MYSSVCVVWESQEARSRDEGGETRGRDETIREKNKSAKSMALYMECHCGSA